MNGLGCELFSGARLSENQYGRRGWGDFFQQATDSRHHMALAHHGSLSLHPIHVVLESQIFSGQFSFRRDFGQ